jgi:hypothetical protein
VETFVDVTAGKILTTSLCSFVLSKVTRLPTVSELEDELFSAGTPDQSVSDSCWYVHVKAGEPLDSAGTEVVSDVFRQRMVVLFPAIACRTPHMSHWGMSSAFRIVTPETESTPIVVSAEVIT